VAVLIGVASRKLGGLKIAKNGALTWRMMMASVVRELAHGQLRCDPRVLYLEIDLDDTSNAEALARDARNLITARLNRISPVDALEPILW
jgi:hypothetical protein